MRELASFILTLVPAVVVWWLGRALARRADDPAFPELRFARGQRTMLAAAVCAVASLTVSPRFLAWKLLLLALGVLIADFPARRRIFSESWGLFGYLWHTTRVWVGFLGPWLLLALLPALIGSAGAYALPVAAGLVLLTLTWHYLNARILPRLVRAVPLQGSIPNVEPEAVLQQARCPAPLLLRADAPGGHWVNAFALPSLQRPAVLFTGGLIDALTPAETRAILAHEVAHLEYFNRRRLLLRGLIVAALAAVPLLAVVRFGAGSSVLSVMAWVWPAVVLITLVALAARNQALEHESDLRALELVRDPEPLISGLTKVHTLLKMPRRWRARSEGRMSHPSLARRLRAIRDAAVAQGLAAAVGEPMGVLVVWSADDATQAAVLDPERLHWLNGVDSERTADASELLVAASDRRSIRYGDLHDLRLEVAGQKRYLSVIDSRGTTLKLAIAAEDVERVKAALERVDLKVQGTTLEASQRHAREATRQRTARLLALLGCLLAVLPPLSLPFLATAALVLARPRRVTLAAAGLVGLAAALLALTRATGFTYGAPSPVIIPVAQALTGMLLLLAAARSGSAHDRTATRLSLAVLAALGLVYLLAWLLRIGAAPPLMQTHLWARQQPGLALALLGLAVALWVGGGRRARAPALVSLVLAAALTFLGSMAFRHAWGDDALAVPQASLVTKPLSAERLVERKVEGYTMTLRLAPAGLGHAVQVGDWDEYDSLLRSTRFLVDIGQNGYHTVDALDLAFLAGDRIAVLHAGPTGAIHLQLFAASDLERPIYDRLLLDEVREPALRVDAVTDRWEVIDVDRMEDRALLLSGRFDSGEIAESRWSLAAEDGSYVSDVKLGGAAGALTVHTYYSDQPLVALSMMLAPLAGYAATQRLELVGAAGRHAYVTALLPWCAEPQVGDTRFVCAANDMASGTGLWSLDANTGEIRPLGKLSGLYYQVERVSGGPARERLLLSGSSPDPLLVDPAAGIVWPLQAEPAAGDEATAADAGEEAGVDRVLRALGGAPSWGPRFQAAALRDDLLAMSYVDGDSSRIVLYRWDREDEPAAAAALNDPRS